MTQMQDKDALDYVKSLVGSFHFTLTADAGAKKVSRKGAKTRRREEEMACGTESPALILRLGGFA
jgi:hypothetical protein